VLDEQREQALLDAALADEADDVWRELVQPGAGSPDGQDGLNGGTLSAPGCPRRTRATGHRGATKE